MGFFRRSRSLLPPAEEAFPAAARARRSRGAGASPAPWGLGFSKEKIPTGKDLPPAPRMPPASPEPCRAPGDITGIWSPREYAPGYSGDGKGAEGKGKGKKRERNNGKETKEEK